MRTRPVAWSWMMAGNEAVRVEFQLVVEAHGLLVHFKMENTRFPTYCEQEVLRLNLWAGR
jgi:hypothetical protein